MPLKEILSWLPDNLAAMVLERPAGTFAIPTAVAVQQLRTGAVRIPFGQLRKGAPAGTFSHDTSHDSTMIDLPLSLILAAIGPNGLARRTDQKQTVVPDEVAGVFGAKDRKVVISGGAAAPAAAKPTAAPASVPKSAPAVPAAPTPTVPKAAPVATPAAPPPAPSRTAAAGAIPIPQPAAARPTAPTAPAAPVATPRMTTSIAQAPAAPAAAKPAAPLPFATTRPAPPPPPPPPAPAPVPTAVAPLVAPEPEPEPAPVPLAATAPVGDDNSVVMTLESIAAAWPDAVLQEIQQFNLVSESVSIPVSRIEPGMKAGRIAFTWGELCGWLSDPLPPSANGHHELELPLAVIAPQFLTKRRASTPRKVLNVGAEVPDLFAGLAKPTAPEPEPQAEPAAAEAPAATAEVPAPTAEEAPQPELAPQEVVEWIMTLPGVAGALLASNDGLLVAGQLPEPLEAETMAAFLPQILMRIGICTEEIRLGPLRSVMLFVGKTPCAMFKAGALCLAVLGHPGKTLPEAALERMAGELAQLNQ